MFTKIIQTFLDYSVPIFKMPNKRNFNLSFCVSVSPEVLGFLTAIGLFIILMTLLFWYLSNKLALENPGSLQCLDDFRKKSELQGGPASFTHLYFSAVSVLTVSRHISSNGILMLLGKVGWYHRLQDPVVNYVPTVVATPTLFLVCLNISGFSHK